MGESKRKEGKMKLKGLKINFQRIISFKTNN